MSAGYRRPQDPLDRLTQQLTALQQIVQTLTAPRPFIIPILAADPPETDPTNMWLLPDGKLRMRFRNTANTAWVYREVSTTLSSGGGSSGTAPAPPAAAPKTFTSSFTATWSQSYRQAGAARTDHGTIYLYYGNAGDGFNGRQRSLIGFDHAAIATALAGSTVKSVALSLHNIHAWWNSGADIHFGIHNFSSEPATWAGGGIPHSMISKHHFGKPQTRVVPLPLEFATRIRDGTGKGIALESPNDSKEFYGYAAGVGSGRPLPILTITYAK